MSKDLYFYDTLRESVVTEINRVRADPTCYIPILQQYISFFKDSNILEKLGSLSIETYEGKNAYEEAISFLKRQRPCHTLTYDERIYKACNDHVLDMGQKGLFSHDGTDGTIVSDRLDRHLEWELSCCESITIGKQSGLEVVISMLVDDGVASRIHREHIFRQEMFYFGVAAGNHTVFKHIVVVNFVGNVRELGKPYFIKSLYKYEYPPELNMSNRKIEKKQKKLKSSYQLQDEDAPDGTTLMKLKKEMRLWEGKKNKVTKKHYTLLNGGHHVVEVEEL